MEKISKKLSVREVCPPNPQRRRLSVPETIMRKHNLAQEHSSSQESKHFHWGNETQCTSDPNLSRKKDFNLIRKSTLLRRLWGDNSKPKLSGSFQEWQYSHRKMSSTQSLNSNHSSPEHIPKIMRETTSPRRKQSSSPNRFSLDENIYNSPKRKTPVIENVYLKALTKTPISRESTTKYTYSSFTNISETNSDSAYTNSISNSTNPVSSSSNNQNHHINEKQSRSEAQSRLSTVSLQESSVQTTDIANLNVISNVNLSQSTLDVIFKEVMKDVGKLTPGEINVSSATVTYNSKNDITVEKVPSISLDTHSDSTEIISKGTNLNKIILSNVRTGSPYTKPSENTQSTIPRFSAVPRTASMEVNTSEEDKEEESDTASFVDSLEDFSSPRILGQSSRSSSGLSQLLPEGKKDTSAKKSSTFFIPIETAKENKVKAVAELLPVKVKERLVERQQKREEKSRQFKSALKTIDSISEIKSTLGLRNMLPKKRNKPILPSIETLKKSSKEKKSEPQKTRSLVKSNPKEPRDRSVYEADKREELLIKPRKVYHGTAYENTQRRIEILEIMECIEVSSEKSPKSKIPVPITSSGNLNRKIHIDKPAYLDFDNHVPDHKLDQLIANILIDSLNHDAESSHYDGDKQNGNTSEPLPIGNNGKYQHKFEAIPEEASALQRSPEQNNNNNSAPLRDQNDNPTRPIKNKTLVKKDLSSIPKGWVTVYTVHKDNETPESTSDEGKKYLEANDAKEATQSTKKVPVVREKLDSECNITNGDSRTEYQNDHFLSSSEDKTNIFESKLLHRPLKKFGYYQRKAKMRRDEQKTSTKGDWSVTVSGTNSYGQMAPDVEMRLKFPKKLVPYNEDSDEGQEKENAQGKRCNFPKIENDRNAQELNNKFRRRSSTGESLPKIPQSQHRSKKKEGSLISMTPSVIIPRQTKTSRSRYHLSRPRERFSLPDVPSMLNERQYYEILRRIPGILTVTGRSISSERKSLEER